MKLTNCSLPLKKIIMFDSILYVFSLVTMQHAMPLIGVIAMHSLAILIVCIWFVMAFIFVVHIIKTGIFRVKDVNHNHIQNFFLSTSLVLVSLTYVGKYSTTFLDCVPITTHVSECRMRMTPNSSWSHEKVFVDTATILQYDTNQYQWNEGENK